jgi:hypothetical protein
MTKYRRAIWYIAAVAAILLVPTWLAVSVLDDRYFSTYPREPQPVRGLVAPYRVKSVTVYVTPEQRRFVTWLFGFDVGMFAIVIVCVALSGGKIDKWPPKNSN